MGRDQDNYGKMWFQAGASGMPGYFQTPDRYGNFTNPEQFETDLNITWGAPVLIADMQGGMNAVRMPDGSLARATGSAGNDVYPRRSPAEGSASATTSTARSSRASSAASVR